MKRRQASRFLGPNPTKAELEAVAALNRCDDPRGVFAEAVADKVLAVWQEKYTKLKRSPCAHALLNRPGVHWSKYASGENCFTTGRQCRPPGEDHSTLWKHKETGERLILIQPYHLDWYDMERLVEWCRRWGFQANIQTTAFEYSNWYYPSRAFPIEITRANN